MVLDSKGRDLQRYDPRTYEVLDLEALAKEAVQVGNPSSAIELHNTAITIVRELAKDNPGNPDHMGKLGNLLYNNSNLLSAVGRKDEALKAISECESVYSRLPQDDKIPIAAWLADVAARRGMIHESLGYGVSAVADLQWAVKSYFALSAHNPDSPHYLDLARVLSDNAGVLARFGDPDLAVASADTAIRMFFSQGDKINERSDSQVYGSSTRRALAVAVVIHKAHGRDDVARQATDLGRSLGGGPPTMDEFIHRYEESIGGERLKLTLTSALASATTLLGRDRVPDSFWEHAKPHPMLGSPGVQTRLVQRDSGLVAGVSGMEPPHRSGIEVPGMYQISRVIPLDRCGAAVAPIVAMTYADLAMDLMPRDPNAGLLLGQEAHYLFAGASRAQAHSMRYQFDVFGLIWARVLLTCSQLYHLDPRQICKDLALDLAGCAHSAANQLMPFAEQIPELRSLVPDCLEYHGKLLIEAGKEAEGKGALQVAAKFAATFPKPSEA